MTINLISGDLKPSLHYNFKEVLPNVFPLLWIAFFFSMLCRIQVCNVTLILQLKVVSFRLTSIHNF